MPCVYLPGPAPAVTVANSKFLLQLSFEYMIRGKYHLMRDIRAEKWSFSYSYRAQLVTGEKIHNSICCNRSAYVQYPDAILIIYCSLQVTHNGVANCAFLLELGVDTINTPVFWILASENIPACVNTSCLPKKRRIGLLTATNSRQIYSGEAVPMYPK